MSFITMICAPKFIRFSIVSVLCVGLIGGAFFAAHAAEQKSLYERLGGYEVISDIIDGFLAKMWIDPQVGRYFVGMGTDTRERLRQKNKLFMCKNTGGPCKIINRDMKISHAGLDITESDWHVAVNHLIATLKTLKVPVRERQELLGLIGGLKGYIVEHSSS